MLLFSLIDVKLNEQVGGCQKPRVLFDHVIHVDPVEHADHVGHVDPATHCLSNCAPICYCLV